VLDLLVELGLARRIDAGNGAALYDGRTEPHQHVVCRACGRVDDLDVELDTAALMAAAGTSGFAPEGTETVVSGLCADCARSNGRAQANGRRPAPGSEPAGARA
jgi:Fe2+ or Zn2+ uptake regulation protein